MIFFGKKFFPEKHILAAIYLWAELSKYVRGVRDESKIWLHLKSGFAEVENEELLSVKNFDPCKI